LPSARAKPVMLATGWEAGKAEGASSISDRRGDYILGLRVQQADWPDRVMRQPTSILITGASSGIGAALAHAYAAPGMQLFLSGRNKTRLDDAAAGCSARGAIVQTAVLDVVDRSGMAEWVRQCAARAPLDLVIANAGVSAGTGRTDESAEQTRTIFAVNWDGVINTVMPAIDAMRPSGRGQVAIMSSLAAFRGFPGAPAYCASKAAVRIWGEALREELRPAGIRVSVVCPGYVESRMTAANDFPMPLLMTAERAAAIIRRGLERDCARIAFPWPTYFGAWLLGVLSPTITDPLMRRLPKKV